LDYQYKEKISQLSDRDIDAIIFQLKNKSTRQNGPAAEEVLMFAGMEWNNRHPGTLPPCFVGRKFPKCYEGIRKIYEWPDVNEQ
jgi:hypothetical protein